MSSLSRVPDLISIEVKKQNKEVVLLCVDDSFQASGDYADTLIENIKLNKYDTTTKISFKFSDNGGRRIGNESSTAAILNSYEKIKSFIQELNTKTVILYTKETSYGRFLEGTFPSLADICNELKIKSIFIIPSLQPHRKRSYITLIEKLPRNTDRIVKLDFRDNPLFKKTTLSELDYLDNSLSLSMAESIYENSNHDIKLIEGIENDIVNHPDLKFKINNDLFIDIIKIK